MTERILIVDDEADIRNLLREILSAEGFSSVKTANTGREAVMLARQFQPDAIVLDVMLPDIDGIEVLRQIRSFSNCSVLFLSAKGDDMDKILGLASGGDDYITKPFSPKELVYRIKSQLRRQQYAAIGSDKADAGRITVGSLTLDPAAMTIFLDDLPLNLTAKEFSLLAYLMENKGMILSKERLYEHVWGEASVVCDNTIMVHIRHLREKIEEDPAAPKRLVTVKGLGYKLMEGKTK